jgi:hypothetical protein
MIGLKRFEGFLRREMFVLLIFVRQHCRSKTVHRGFEEQAWAQTVFEMTEMFVRGAMMFFRPSTVRLRARQNDLPM